MYIFYFICQIYQCFNDSAVSAFDMFFPKEEQHVLFNMLVFWINVKYFFSLCFFMCWVFLRTRSCDICDTWSALSEMYFRWCLLCCSPQFCESSETVTKCNQVFCGNCVFFVFVDKKITTYRNTVTALWWNCHKMSSFNMKTENVHI